jgi:Trk K+ transport system NAD-binding subunit
LLPAKRGFLLLKIAKLPFSVFLILALYSIIFLILMQHEGQSENANLVTAFYWVAATITTLGYGDIVFHSPAGQIFSVIVVFSGLAILWAVVIPLGITPRLDKMIRASPSSAPEKIMDHIIISGYNPLVETLVERLTLLEIPFVVIERSQEVAREIYQKYPVLWGDPSEKGVLSRANIGMARLFIANEKEELNADVILTLREISNIEIIALADDLGRARFLRYAGASRVISPKTLLGTFIAQITATPRRNIFPGAIQLFCDLLLSELPIYPGSDLIGKRLVERSILETGATVVGIWQRGVFVPNPGQNERIQSNSVLMVVGGLEQLSRIRDLTVGTRKEGPLIILGYGDVGRRVAKVLGESGINPLIVDKRDLEAIPFEHITGDATIEVNLVSAGIKRAVGVLILLNRDPDVIYATLLARNLNPNAFIVARASHVKSAEKIYRAGADYVASVPIVASHMLAKIVQDEEEELALLYEDLELKIVRVGKKCRMTGGNLGEIDLPGRFGCRAVAIQRGNEAVTSIDGNLVIKSGDVMAIIGSPESIESFSSAYASGPKPVLKRLLKFYRNALQPKFYR